MRSWCGNRSGRRTASVRRAGGSWGSEQQGGPEPVLRPPWTATLKRARPKMIEVSPRFVVSHPFASKKSKGWGAEVRRGARDMTARIELLLALEHGAELVAFRGDVVDGFLGLVHHALG